MAFDGVSVEGLDAVGADAPNSLTKDAPTLTMLRAVCRSSAAMTPGIARHETILRTILNQCRI